ncbi:MAG: GLPGLI family protein [Flavobacteriaceae bacterium]|nr:GLPGLI family protein [Flavobacteriaceae bacterium]
MKSILKRTSLLLLFVFSISVSAQEFRGKATYIKKTSMSPEMKKQIEESKMSDSRKKRMTDMFKKNSQSTYTLNFDKSKSIYKKEEKLEVGGNKGGRGMHFMSADSDMGPAFMDVKNKKSVRSPEFMGKNFLIKGDLEDKEWKLEKESKQIGGYMCFKATTTKQVPNTKSTFMFMRSSDEDKKEESDEPKTKTVIITAWYTPQIPVNQGPDMYWGLPGLIMELREGNSILLCTKLSINGKGSKSIKEPSKGKKITQEKYDKVVAKKTAEMKKRFKNSRGRKGGHSRRMH